MTAMFSLQTARADGAADAPDDDPLDDAVLSQLAADIGPQVLREVLAQFLAEAMDRARCIAAPDSAPELVLREAHTLKSTAATFGARRLAHTAREVETLCRAGTADRAETLRRSLPGLVRDAAAAFTRPGAVSAGRLPPAP